MWAATPSRQRSPGYADPGDSGSLPGVGESLGTEEGSSPAADGHPKCKGVSSDPWEFECVGKDSLREELRTPVSGANVVLGGRGESQRKGSGCSRDASQGMLSSLIAWLPRTAQEDNPAEVKVPPDVGTGRLPVAPFPETTAQSPVLGAEPVMVCFSCGRPGHGVNRCFRVNTLFPFFATGLGGYYPRWPMSGGMA